MFENKRQRLLPRKEFLLRMLRYALMAGAFITVSLFIGITGYHYWGQLGWLNSFYNASMILGGMGPADEIKTVSGKIFASLYALYSGIAFIGISALLLAPIVHRFFHIIHLEKGAEKST